MGADQNLDWHRAAASALAWWDDAGVDTLVDEAPRDWLAAPAPAAPAGAPIAIAPTPDILPATLAEFLAWRHGADAPDAGWSGACVEAEGPEDAAIMVLVDCPDREGGDALMGAAATRLFDRMLAAIGLTRGDVHIAAVCARRPPPGPMPADLRDRLGEVARHHVALVAPERLLLLGDGASRAVLGMTVAAARDGLRSLDRDGQRTGVVASWHPQTLLGRPMAKAEAWKDLLLLVGGMTR